MTAPLARQGDVPRIGPNAVLQMSAALRALGGAALEREMLERAGLSAYANAPPQAMIPQDEAIRLFKAVHGAMDERSATRLSREAGLATADYILAHRIPMAAQRILRVLPRALSARLLLSAIGKHAWTFAGSGEVTWRFGRPLVIEIADNPLTFPRCHWHSAVFERLFAKLVSPDVRIVHRVCCADGEKVCRFEIQIQ